MTTPHRYDPPRARACAPRDPGDAYIPPVLSGVTAHDDPNAYEPAAARALLDAAGWKLGADGVRVRDGKRLELSLAGFAGSASARSFDVQVQSELRGVGIDVQIKDFAPATFFAPAAAGGPIASGNYDLAPLNWLSGTDLDNAVLF